ncbi:MAG: ATP-binding cassette domain-containing protein [Desulfobulbaceae bacterium]|nr:ATP-binding cassette domain-containing protein [Desulfobulbaceae bacterium]
MSDASIKLTEVTRHHNARHGVYDITFQLMQGEVLSICGPSGSGKSTILRLIAGLDPLDSGHIQLLSKPASSPGFTLAPHRRRCAMIFQDLALWPHMTVAKHLHFVLPHLSLADRKERTTTLLSKVQLEQRVNAYPHQLSGGQQQRLAIARALAADPVHLLMDEPFSSLDFQLKMEMIELLSTLKEENRITVIYVTHDLREILRLSDSMLVLDNGRTSFHGKKQDFIKKYQTEIAREQQWSHS